MSWEAEAWRARIEQDTADFAADRVNILLAKRTPGGLRLALPAAVNLGDPTDPGEGLPAEERVPFLIVPNEVAQVLFNALAAHFVGTSDVVRLARELEHERRRVDTLLCSLDRLTEGKPR
jgi:hypothetical protein